MAQRVSVPRRLTWSPLRLFYRANKNFKCTPNSIALRCGDLPSSPRAASQPSSGPQLSRQPKITARRSSPVMFAGRADAESDDEEAPVMYQVRLHAEK